MFLSSPDAIVDGMVKTVINVSNTQAASTALARSLGSVIVMRVGVDSFATKTSTTALTTDHARMVPPVLTLHLGRTHVSAHQDSLAPTVRSSMTLVPPRHAGMAALVSILVMITLCASVPQDLLVSIVKYLVSPAGHVLVCMEPPVLTALQVISVNAVQVMRVPTVNVQ